MISVAMTTFNGEKYIKEQLDSILHQTKSIDELIISDDGSTDKTIEIIKSYEDERIILLQNNPNHGYCGNFEWAIQHTNGNFIFLSDQDDIWVDTKVEKTIEIFNKHPDIELVITHGVLINKNGNYIDGSFGNCLNGSSRIIERDSYLNTSIWYAVANGMCMCFTQKLKDDILPFPISTTCHDRWIAFCAICNYKVYYLNEELVKYRIHDTNTSMRGNISLKKRFEKALDVAYGEPYNMYNMANAMLKKLKRTRNYETIIGVFEATKMSDLHYKQICAINGTLWRGTYELFELYRKNELYKKNGKKYFFVQLFLVWFGKGYMTKHKREL